MGFLWGLLPFISWKRGHLITFNTKITHLGDALPALEEYGVFVTWQDETPREGAGPLPALLLDQGQLPDLLPAPLGRDASPT